MTEVRDLEVVLLAARAVELALGAPELRPYSTKKILKWSDRSGITVNINRESKRAAAVWIAGTKISRNGKLDVLVEEIVPSVPPKNSNCSAIIKRGPTLIAYVKTADQMECLTKYLKQMKLGEPSMSVAGQMTPESDGSDIEQDDEALQLPTNQTRVLTQSRDESVDALVSRIRKGRLILQPEFQRDFVWSHAKAGALIESVLMRIPLPVIYVAELADGSWEVVDGQQRLTAIRAFVDGTFPDGSHFRLGQLRVRADLRGKSFTDLNAEDQNAIEDYSVRIILILKEADEDLKFEVFERLNSGADKLNDMELRNCVYRGPYNDLLKDLVKNDILLKVRGDEVPDVRMQDRQLLLRFFAMWRNTHLRYRAPMKQFMNHEMQVHRFVHADDVAAMKKKFESAIQCAWDVFGDKAFRRYSLGDVQQHDGKWESGGKLNIALWDTILYVFTYYERRQILPVADAIREEFLDMLTFDDTFIDYIGRTTDKPDRVRYRAETWKHRLDGLINTPANETRTFSSALKKRLYDADPSCLICSQRIHAPDDAEVDHIAHYWRGGPTIPENARLTHRYCNRQRGGRP